MTKDKSVKYFFLEKVTLSTVKIKFFFAFDKLGDLRVKEKAGLKYKDSFITNEI